MKLLLRNPKVLVIDDEKGIREGLRRLLEMEGLKIETAKNGQEGLNKGTLKEFDLYLIDLKLPDLDGIEVLKEIKTTYPEAVCIIMTAYGSISSAVEAIKIGAFSYITKPFLPEDIIAITIKALEHRWYILEARRLKEEQHKRFLEVAYEQSRLKTIINSIGDGVLVLNRKKELVLYNRKFVLLLGINKPFMIGEEVSYLLPDIIVKQVEKISTQHDKIQILTEELVVEHPMNKVVLLQTSPILDEKKEFLGTVTVVRDITELKRVEQVKNQFVNMVAHELKAPVAAIVGYLDMIANRTLGDKLDTYDKFIDRSIKRAMALQNLVNDLLNLSRMEAGTIRREIVNLNLSSILSETIEFFSEEAKKKNVSIKTNIQPNIFFHADEEEIRRVFSNFISNGIKYNKEGGILEIIMIKENHVLQIQFKDSGIGMTAEERKNLFKEFFRAKNQYTRNIPGTGLGLSIAKKIVDFYNGSIEVDSKFQEGTTFTILFPL